LASRFSLRVSFGSFFTLTVRDVFPDIAMHASLLQLACSPTIAHFDE
jgi:hypothetical protein